MVKRKQITRIQRQLFITLASQTVTPNAAWNAADCDSDGVNNGQEHQRNLIHTADSDNDGK
jgi:hypothetical protein